MSEDRPLPPTQATDLRQFAERLSLSDEDLTGADYAFGLREIQRILASRLSGVSKEEVQDLSSEIMLKIVQIHRRGTLDAQRQPGAYLLRVIHNATMDLLRDRAMGSGREILLDPATMPDVVADDVVAATIDRAATAQRVREALTRARGAGDSTAFRVASYFLDESERTGTPPSNRRIAETLGLSHVGVAKALQRFRSHLERLD